MTLAVFGGIVCVSAGSAQSWFPPAGGKPLNLPNFIQKITSSSGPFCNSVLKRDENRSERRRFSMGKHRNIRIGEKLRGYPERVPYDARASGRQNAEKQKMQCCAGGTQSKVQLLSPANRRLHDRKE